MAEAVKTLSLQSVKHLRDRLALAFGVRPERKAELYFEISRSASLKDASYWSQILFAAGIATLGLALGSPAVIIGAMLISPLMGPILAAGLALAAGDLALGLRAGIILALSCLVAVAFSVLLVILLPFKEMTGEIAARTQPNTLDLVVALFSGAVGSLAICKEVKGVVTSIPGVAIAVALMPPLCVVGYGVGVAVSLNGAEGLRIASGGGLLFLTNLVAISFTAMLVFLALHIDTDEVKEQVKAWRRENPESKWERFLRMKFHLSNRTRQIGGLRARFLVIAIPLILITIPLSRSLIHLKQEIEQQRRENRVRRAATEVWEQNFGKLPNGEPRSYLDQLTVHEQDDRLLASLRVFTGQLCTANEKSELTRLLAARLSRPPESVNVQLIEIPTAATALSARARDEKLPDAPPTASQLQAQFRQSVEAALNGLRFPPATRLVNYRVTASGAEPMRITLTYLGDHEIGADAQSLISEEVRARCSDPSAIVGLEHVPISFELVRFERNQSRLAAANLTLLDQAGQALRSNPTLRAEIVAQSEKGEREKIASERAGAAIEYLAAKWQVDSSRLTSDIRENTGRSVSVRISEGVADHSR
jgi:uncharacterized hydrophobic protein (TIGR00271 family)